MADDRRRGKLRSTKPRVLTSAACFVTAAAVAVCGWGVIRMAADFLEYAHSPPEQVAQGNATRVETPRPAHVDYTQDDDENGTTPLKSAVEEDVRGYVVRTMVGTGDASEKVDVQCPAAVAHGGRGDCGVGYGGVDIRVGVTVANVTYGAPLISYELDISTDQAIVTQESLNRAFWHEDSWDRERADPGSYEAWCETIAEPTVVQADEAAGIRCHSTTGTSWSSYPLDLSELGSGGGFGFAERTSPKR